MRNSQKSISDQLVKWFPLLLITGVLYFFYQQIVFYVAPGYGAVLTQGTQVKKDLLSEGVHLKWPFFSRVEFVNLHLLNYEVPVEGYSKDLQLIYGKVTLLFNLNSETFPTAFQKMGNQKTFVQNIFIPIVKATFQAVTASTEAKEWILNREAMADQFQKKVQTALDQILQPLSFQEVVQLRSFSLTQLRLPNDLLKLWQANARSEALTRNIQQEANVLKGNETILSLRTIEKINERFTASNLIKSVTSTNLGLSTSSPALPSR